MNSVLLLTNTGAQSCPLEPPLHQDQSLPSMTPSPAALLWESRALLTLSLFTPEVFQ